MFPGARLRVEEVLGETVRGVTARTLLDDCDCPTGVRIEEREEEPRMDGAE
ncbi:MAG TPA: hypothetical protein VMT52_03105 [Planctomycetota bacterium]|nr:hypothetical protein [Planctomycetota bacterium]